ncbi:hypothetical protein vseg_020412 [Gypsophila vaccaria]
MKPAKLTCDAPLVVQEWKRVIGEELKFAHETATNRMNTVVRDHHSNTNQGINKCIPSTTRQKFVNNVNEDPIRVIMFLGPWSHT